MVVTSVLVFTLLSLKFVEMVTNLVMNLEEAILFSCRMTKSPNGVISQQTGPLKSLIPAS